MWSICRRLYVSRFEALIEERQQATPMPLRTRLVVDAVAVGHRPAMLHADVVFNRVVDAADAERLRQPRRLLGRKTSINTRSSDIDPGLDLVGRSMRAV